MLYFFIALLFICFINVENAFPKGIYQKMIYVDNWTLLSRQWSWNKQTCFYLSCSTKLEKAFARVMF